MRVYLEGWIHSQGRQNKSDTTTARSARLVARWRAEGKTCIQFPVRAQFLFVPPETCSETLPPPNPAGAWVLSERVNWPGDKAYHSIQSSVKIKNSWSLYPVSPHSVLLQRTQASCHSKFCTKLYWKPPSFCWILRTFVSIVLFSLLWFYVHILHLLFLSSIYLTLFLASFMNLICYSFPFVFIS